jgi:hypothetical protein
LSFYTDILFRIPYQPTIDSSAPKGAPTLDKMPLDIMTLSI